MKSVVIRKAGKPEVLELVDSPIPKIGKEEVLVKVDAAGVNRPDILQRKGLYKVPKDASPIPGLEVSGEIVETGQNVNGEMCGNKVVALTHGGGYAEYCKVNLAHCLDWPEGLNQYEAAALPETAFTVFHNLIDRGTLKSGELLLLHGGSSGIGVMAIQVAKAIGATVFVTAGSEEKCGFCIEVGADHAINYTHKDFKKEIKEISDRGVDVVLDMVGGSYFPQNLDLLDRDGRYVSIAFLLGHKVELNLGTLLMNRLKITGSTLRPQSTAEKTAIATGVREILWPMISEGKIRSYIDTVFDLKDAAAAHRLMESSSHKGKIVLKVRET